MRLLLIRHSESVDNVAGLYGGSRDAPLTAHGVLQAQRLATHLAASFTLTHIFSSPLQRALKTATAICEAQNKTHADGLSVAQRPQLREKHFGTWEGVKFSPTPTEPALDVESHESMKDRVAVFLDECLCPLRGDECVAVVAHGVILGVLARSLLQRHGRVLDRWTWSNTGYVDMIVTAQNLRVLQVDCTLHLKGLHKTRGGIGSAAFDERQKTLDSFFPKRTPQK